MSLAQLKSKAEEFRAVADDSAAVDKLADATIRANKTDTELVALCNEFHDAADGDEVRAIADRVKARTN